MASPVTATAPDPEGAPDAKRAKTEPGEAPTSASRPPSPAPSSASGIRCTQEGWHIPVGKDKDGDVTWALIIKDTSHEDEMYEVQLEEAVHGRSGTLKVWSKDVHEYRNMAWEERTKLWTEREKYFASYVQPGSKVLNQIGKQAMREALRSLQGGRNFLERWNDTSEAWEMMLDPLHSDEESAMRAAEVFDATIKELEECREDFFYSGWAAWS